MLKSQLRTGLLFVGLLMAATAQASDDDDILGCWRAAESQKSDGGWNASIVRVTKHQDGYMTAEKERVGVFKNKKEADNAATDAAVDANEEEEANDDENKEKPEEECHIEWEGPDSWL